MGCCQAKSGKRLRSSSTLPSTKKSLYGATAETIEFGSFRKRIRRLQAVPLDKTNEGVQEALNASISKPQINEANRRLILQALKRHMVFSSLAEEQSASLIYAMKLYSLDLSEIIFEQGCTGSNFYVIAAGKVEVLVNRRRVNILGVGESFGEMALLQDLPRSATVITLEPSQMWVIDRAEFSNALKLANLATYGENREFIEGVSLFKTLTQTQREGLIGSLTTHKFVQGDLIVKEGESGDLFYIIQSGTVSCSQQGTVIRKLYKGDYFGEQALLYSCTRTATCCAFDAVVKCLSITRANLTRALGSSLQKIIYRNSLRIAFTNSETLSQLTRDQQERIIDRMSITAYRRGAVVIESGSKMGQRLLVVVKGALAAEGSDVSIAGLHMTVGEHEIMVKEKTTYHLGTVALKDSDIAEISRSDLEAILEGSLEVACSSNQMVEILKKAEIFNGLSQENLQRLSSLLTLRSYREYEVIFAQDTRDSSFYLIKEGTVDIVKSSHKVRSLTKLDYFGERAILLNEPRSASVIAKTAVTCWLLSRESFASVVSQKTLSYLTARMQMQDENVSLDLLLPVQVIGRGNFGTVVLVVHKLKSTVYALKAVPRWKVTTYSLYESMVQEKNVLAQLNHMFILKSIKTFKDSTHLYFLTEFVKGTDLFDVLRKLGLVSDEDAKFLIASLVLILEHLHERNIVYRDLKPENLLVDDNGYLKLVDFGTAKVLDGRTFTLVGTPHYMAPEVILGKGYDCFVDYWTLGVILYELVCAVLPFGEDLRNPYEVYEAVVAGQLQYPKHVKRPFASQSVIEQLLSKNPASRVGGSLHKFKKHKWFRGFDWVGLCNKELPTPYIPQVEDYSTQISAALAKPKSIGEFLAFEERNDDKSAMKRRAEPFNWDADF